MWFAAKEAYERRLAVRKRREGLSEGYRGGFEKAIEKDFDRAARRFADKNANASCRLW
jgi:hypothetical protein